MGQEDLLAFSEVQQYAILGHALQNYEIWDTLKGFGINDKWVGGALSELWKVVDNFKVTFNRNPKTTEECVSSVKDELIQGAIKRGLTKCLEEKEKYPWDGLEKKLTQYAKSRLIYVTGQAVSVAWNEGRHGEAEKLWQDAALQLQKIELIRGVEVDGFRSAADRVREELDFREADSKKTIDYALSFAQDATLGMLPTDVTLIGATSGAGKTELAKIQAAYTAEQGKQVHVFALEAEQYEIERRIKYGLLSRWYRDEKKQKGIPIPKGMITYKNWRHNKLETELSQYEERVNEEFNKKYKTLNTYYRKANEFTIEDLDNKVLKLKGTSSLIILDHIHFFDLQSENENREMKLLIKKIKKLADSLEIPIFTIAHINKQNKNLGLVPNKEDFMGSSDLFKVVTQCLLLAPARNAIVTDTRGKGKPTFVRFGKSRIDGSIIFDVGICFYDIYTGTYTPYYSVGRLEKGDRKWKSLKTDLPAWVDPQKNIVDISDIE
jgi:hypothetical protein